MSVRDILQAAAGLGGGEAGETGLQAYHWGFNQEAQMVGLEPIVDEVPKKIPDQDGQFANVVFTDAGNDHALVLFANGQLVGWGQNNVGQLGAPYGLLHSRFSPTQVTSTTDWANFCCAGTTTLGIKTNGTLWVWGATQGGIAAQNLNTPNGGVYTSPVQIGSLTNWETVSGGFGWAIAKKTDGTLWFWGSGTNGVNGQNSTVTYSSPIQIGALTDWDKIAAAFSSWHAIKTDGSLWGCGGNTGGALGKNDAISVSSPVQIGASTDWAYIRNGSSTSMAKKTDGSLWAWGTGSSGQIGNNLNQTKSSPVQVGADTDWVNVNIKGNATYATRTNGTLWSWGIDQFSGNLGLGTRNNRSSPAQVGTANNWSHALLVGQAAYGFESNNMYSWGSANVYGRRGDYRKVPLHFPEAFGDVGEYKLVVPGYAKTFLIKSDGTLWGLGQNSDGGIGLNTVDPYISSPVQVGSDTDWKAVAVGLSTVLALKDDGSLWSWGRSNFGASARAVDTSSPIQIGADTNWAKIAVGFRESFAIKTDGSLWAVGGYNNLGGLGLNDTVRRSSPVQIGSDTDWSMIAAGTYAAYALKTDGSLYSWGNNSIGELGLGDKVARSSPTQIGTAEWQYVACPTGVTTSAHAIKTDGTMWAWGNNSSARLGIGNFQARSSPTQVGSANTWVWVMPGDSAVNAVDTSGRLWGWGSDTSGIAGIGTRGTQTSPRQCNANNNLTSNTWSSSNAYSNATQQPIGGRYNQFAFFNVE